MKTFQRKLFHTLSELHWPDNQWKQTCMELLNVGRSAFYKRMRGETPMMMYEIYQLTSHFQLSIDHLISEDKTLVPFKFPRGPYQEFSLKKLFGQMTDDFFSFKSLPNVRLHILANDLPLYYYLDTDALLKFKFFCWELTKPGKSIWDTAYKTLDWEENVQLAEQCEMIHDLFLHMPRTEIWSDTFLNKTLKQINYHLHHTTGFDEHHAHEVMDELIGVIDKLQERICHHYNTAVNGTVAKYSFFINENETFNNTLMVKSDALNEVQIYHDYPNFIKSNQVPFCEFTEEMITKIRLQSDAMEAKSKNDREIWFTQLKDSIQEFEQRLFVEF